MVSDELPARLLLSKQPDFDIREFVAGVRVEVGGEIASRSLDYRLFSVAPAVSHPRALYTDHMPHSASTLALPFNLDLGL